MSFSEYRPSDGDLADHCSQAVAHLRLVRNTILALESGRSDCDLDQVCIQAMVHMLRVSNTLRALRNRDDLTSDQIARNCASVELLERQLSRVRVVTARFQRRLQAILRASGEKEEEEEGATSQSRGENCSDGRKRRRR